MSEQQIPIGPHEVTSAMMAEGNRLVVAAHEAGLEAERLLLASEDLKVKAQDAKRKQEHFRAEASKIWWGDQ